jgi:integrase
MAKARRPRGSGSIRRRDRALYLRYRPPGAKRQVEQHFPRLPNEGMKDYRDRAEAELSKITLGLAAGIRVAPTARTVQDLADSYLASVETEVKGRTIDTYQATINNYIAPVLGSRKVSGLTSDDIRSFKRHLLQRKVAGGNTMAVSTARRAMGQLHDLLNYAMDGQDTREYWGITFDPWPKKRFKWPDEREKPAPRTYAPYTVEETRMFLAACPEPMRVRFLTIILLMLRQGEFIAMQWKHLDEKEGIYHVVDNHSRKHGFTTTKTASSQAPVPVPSALLEELREHKKRQAAIRLRHAAEWSDQDLIFPTRNGTTLGHAW